MVPSLRGSGYVSLPFRQAELAEIWGERTEDR